MSGGQSDERALVALTRTADQTALANLAAALSGLQESSPQILPGAFTVDAAAKMVDGALYQPLPPASDNVGKYARAVDLFGSKTDLLLASKAGTMTFWQPVRPDYAAKIAMPADSTFYAIRQPNICIITGVLPALGLFRTITLSPTLAFPGAKFRIKNTMTGLGTLRIGNVNLGTPLSILVGATQEFAYDMTDGWVQIT